MVMMGGVDEGEDGRSWIRGKILERRRWDERVEQFGIVVEVEVSERGSEGDGQSTKIRKEYEGCRRRRRRWRRCHGASLTIAYR